MAAQLAALGLEPSAPCLHLPTAAARAVIEGGVNIHAAAYALPDWAVGAEVLVVDDDRQRAARTRHNA